MRLIWTDEEYGMDSLTGPALWAVVDDDGAMHLESRGEGVPRMPMRHEETEARRRNSVIRNPQSAPVNPQPEPRTTWRDYLAGLRACCCLLLLFGACAFAGALVGAESVPHALLAGAGIVGCVVAAVWVAPWDGGGR